VVSNPMLYLEENLPQFQHGKVLVFMVQ
jgi:hypothetical protein